MIAAVTMVWNESERLPRWLSHYGRELGSENLYVLDDGSDDGSTDGLAGAHVVRLHRRKEFDEVLRAQLVSEFVSGLLKTFETVIYTDVDEFITPIGGGGLADAVNGSSLETITTLGFDILHLADWEPPINLNEPIMSQRRHGRFNATYSKPLVTRVPVAWRPGFHFSDRATAFDGLLLFHMRYADKGMGLRRLKRSREVVVAGEGLATHWRAGDEAFLETLSLAAQALFQPFDRTAGAGWERLLLARLRDRPKNAVELIRNLPDIYPSYYLFSDFYAQVG